MESVNTVGAAFTAARKDWFSYIEKRYSWRVDLGLERIHKVAAQLKLLNPACPVITVAGTNGKGSCVAFLEAILLAADYKVATYTSPHLISFNERIHINGKEIDNDALFAAFAVVDKAANAINLSYFEFVTLTALYLFQQSDLDIIVLEVGLGGRLDATNVVAADIAVITSIAIDHVDYLGNDREKIGYEKAGIMRAGKPVVSGDAAPPQSLIKQAEKLDAPFYGLRQGFNYRLDLNATWNWQTAEHQLTNLPVPKLPLPSAAAALMALSLFNPEIIANQSAVVQGLTHAFLPGRYECFARPKPTIVDVAHNPAAAAFLATKLSEQKLSGSILAVVGMLQDKDIAGTLAPLLPLVSKWYLADLSVSRGAKAKILAQALEDLGQKSCYTFISVKAAYAQAVAECGQNDKIVMFGSFYTVSEIYKDLCINKE